MLVDASGVCLAPGRPPQRIVSLIPSTTELLSFASTVTSGGTTANPAAFGPALDNVSITATTPLPAALPLFAGGAGLLGFIMHRKKKRAAVAVPTGG